MALLEIFDPKAPPVPPEGARIAHHRGDAARLEVPGDGLVLVAGLLPRPVGDGDGGGPLRAAGLDEVFRQRHALAVERGDLVGREVLQFGQLAEREPLAVAGAALLDLACVFHFRQRGAQQSAETEKS